MTGLAPARYSLLSFDLDGTLVDTASEIAEAANRTLADFRLPRQSVPVVTRLIGAGTRELMLGLLRGLVSGGAAAADSIDREAVLRGFAVHYADTAGTMCRAYDGAQAALLRLGDAGIRLACVTNKERRYSERVLAACGLDQAFDLLVAGDTLAVKKPDARVLQHAMNFFAAEARATAHVGDSRTDVEAARNAGVAAWVVPYGYNGGQPIEQAHPDRIFQDLGAVATHVCTPA
jgi:phosphoglycolate phosphatase